MYGINKLLNSLLFDIIMSALPIIIFCYLRHKVKLVYCRNVETADAPTDEATTVAALTSNTGETAFRSLLARGLLPPGSRTA